MIKCILLILSLSSFTQAKKQSPQKLKKLVQKSEPYSDKMQSLSGHKAKSLDQFTKKDVFVFFQADCSACHSLIKNLSCLESKYEISLLGSISDVQALKKEYKKYKVKYPAYFADPIAMAKLPIEIAATPQVIHWTKKPKLHLGYKPCEQYLKLLSKN